MLVGAVLGYEFGLFAARLMASARLLPATVPAPAAARRPSCPATALASTQSSTARYEVSLREPSGG